MQFLWPFKAPFLIIDSMMITVILIGIPSRKYVWIMARDHVLDQNIYDAIISKLEKVGYDITQIQKITQLGIKFRIRYIAFIK